MTAQDFLCKAHEMWNWLTSFALFAMLPFMPS